MGSHLGEFKRAGEHYGKPYYEQRDTEGNLKTFLYSEGGTWWVKQGSMGGTIHPGLQNKLGDTLFTDSSSWLYWMQEGMEGEWKVDATLKLEFTSLSPCDMVRVAGQGDVLEQQGGSLGNYRFLS